MNSTFIKPATRNIAGKAAAGAFFHATSQKIKNIAPKPVSMRNLLLLLLLPAAFAAAADIGVYVINAGKFDPQSGSYSVDFYLSYKCDSPCEPNFEFTNGRAQSVDKIIDSPTEKFYRIQANLQDPVDLRRYPFDSHNLTIEIEDKTETVDNLAYSANMEESGMEPSIQFVGWKLKGWNAAVTEHYYPPYDETYSNYVFTIELERETLSALLKIFAPVFFIMMLNFATHFLDPHLVPNRLILHSSFMVATVMFHVAIGNQLPPLGYLTVADKFMFAAYLPLAFSIASAIAVMELSEEKRDKDALRVHKLSRPASFAIWVAGIALVLLTM